MDLCAIPTSRYILTCTKVVHYLFPESQLVTKVTLYIHNSTYILDKMSVIFYINFQRLESTLELSHHSSYRSPKIFNFKVKLVLFLIIDLFLAHRPLFFQIAPSQTAHIFWKNFFTIQGPSVQHSERTKWLIISTTSWLCVLFCDKKSGLWHFLKNSEWCQFLFIHKMIDIFYK